MIYSLKKPGSLTECMHGLGKAGWQQLRGAKSAKYGNPILWNYLAATIAKLTSKHIRLHAQQNCNNLLPTFTVVEAKDNIICQRKRSGQNNNIKDILVGHIHDMAK